MRIRKKIFILSLGFQLIWAIPLFGATLYFDPEKRECKSGEVFLVHLKINTEDEKINAIDGQIIFPPDILEVVEVSTGGSIFSLWPEFPRFDNLEGKIFFVGGVPLGFQGEGKVLTIALRAIERKIEESFAEIEISNETKIFLNDGEGNLASFQKSKAEISIKQGKEELKNEWISLVQEDKIPPEPFEVFLVQDPLLFEGKYFIVFQATDNQTGIDHYEIKEGKKDWKPGNSPYLLEDQSLKEKVLVKAVDKAGNERIVELRITKKKEKREKIFIILKISVLFLLGLLIFALKKRRK